MWRGTLNDLAERTRLMFKIVAIIAFLINGGPESATRTHVLASERFATQVECSRFYMDHGMRIGLRARPYGNAIKKEGHFITSFQMACVGG
jgi:hypothetical protein